MNLRSGHSLLRGVALAALQVTAAIGAPPTEPACEGVQSLAESAKQEFAREKTGAPSPYEDGSFVWQVKGQPAWRPDPATGQWLGCFVVDAKDYVSFNCSLTADEGLSQEELRSAVRARAAATASCLGMLDTTVTQTRSFWFRVSPEAGKPPPRVVFAYSAEDGVYMYMVMLVRND